MTLNINVVINSLSPCISSYGTEESKEVCCGKSSVVTIYCNAASLLYIKLLGTRLYIKNNITTLANLLCRLFHQTAAVEMTASACTFTSLYKHVTSNTRQPSVNCFFVYKNILGSHLHFYR
jgi:hypothetical protein